MENDESRKKLTITIPFDIYVDELDWGLNKEYIAGSFDLPSEYVLANSEEESIKQLEEELKKGLIEKAKSYELGIAHQRVLGSFLANRRVIFALEKGEDKMDIIRRLNNVQLAVENALKRIQEENGNIQE